MKFRVPILKRLIPSLKKQYCRLFWPGGFGTVRSNGALFRLNYKNFVDRQIAFYDDYEQRQLDYLMSELTRIDADTFLDIGANIGFYSIIIAKSDLTADIIAFEPDARNVERFNENAVLNDLADDLNLYPLLVSDRTGELDFQLGSDTSTGQSKVSESGGISVQSVSIDDFLSLKDKNLGIKIDVEGHELAVLKGMKRTLQDNNCLLQIEIFGDNLSQATELLSKLGYSQNDHFDHDYFFSR